MNKIASDSHELKEYMEQVGNVGQPPFVSQYALYTPSFKYDSQIKASIYTSKIPESQEEQNAFAWNLQEGYT